jgi:hypothetical protein
MDRFSDPKAEDPRWETETDNNEPYVKDSWLTKGNNSRRPVDMRQPGEWQSDPAQEKALSDIVKLGQEYVAKQEKKSSLKQQMDEIEQEDQHMKQMMMNMVRSYPKQAEAIAKLRELGVFNYEKRPFPHGWIGSQGTAQNNFWGKMKGRM